MINHAKTLTDDNIFHLLLKSVLGQAVAVATDQCKKTLCQIVTEFILPELWKITKLQGNYEALEVRGYSCALYILSLLSFLPFSFK